MCICRRFGTGYGDYKKYGPFRYTVGPQENKNPTNGQIFNYLEDKDKYNIKQILTPKDPKSKFPTGQEPNIKLFGYGFSGSGKTILYYKVAKQINHYLLNFTDD